MNRQAIGQRIKNLRENLGISQEKLSNMLEIGPKHLSNIECGQKAPSINLCIKICTLFNLSLDFLILGKLDNYSSELKETSPSYNNITSLLSTCNEKDLEIITPSIKDLIMMTKHFK